MRVHVFVSPLFAQHEAPPGHPERPARYQAVLRGIEQSAVAANLTRRETREATEHELQRVHQPAYLARLAGIAGKRGNLDGDTYYSPYSYSAALHAAGAACQMVEALVSGEADYGMVACRPPGHHATSEGAMGFCLINNVAVAARAATAMGVSRVAIVDWDVHHGNGTEAVFLDAGDVLFLSTHESPQYPGTGLATEVGGPAAKGKTVNIPLSSGAGDAAYGEAFEELIVPILEQFDPQLVLISAGYDAHRADPLGGMELTDAGFGHLTRHVLSRLPNYGAQKLGFVIEGGYDLTALTNSVDATLSALASPEAPRFCGHAGLPWRHEIRWARSSLSEYWDLD
jgi:acetoin utilization deacetylase AcuC-like enzyme